MTHNSLALYYNDVINHDFIVTSFVQNAFELNLTTIIDNRVTHESRFNLYGLTNQQYTAYMSCGQWCSRKYLGTGAVQNRRAKLGQIQGGLQRASQDSTRGGCKNVSHFTL